MMDEYSYEYKYTAKSWVRVYYFFKYGYIKQNEIILHLYNLLFKND